MPKRGKRIRIENSYVAPIKKRCCVSCKTLKDSKANALYQELMKYKLNNK
jgi:hypothetical protein